MSGYEDGLLKVEVSGQSKSVDANGAVTVRIAFVVRNKSASPLLLGQVNQEVTVSDENGNSCASYLNLSGLPLVATNSQVTAYSSIAPGSSLSFSWTGEARGTCPNFTGHIYNVSFQLMRRDSGSGFGIPVGVGFTGLTILPR